MRRLGGGEGMASIARSRRRTPFCQRGAMEKEKTYNGFTNYETWAVSLWLGNEYASYQYWREKLKKSWYEKLACGCQIWYACWVSPVTTACMKCSTVCFSGV